MTSAFLTLLIFSLFSEKAKKRKILGNGPELRPFLKSSRTEADEADREIDDFKNQLKNIMDRKNDYDNQLNVFLAQRNRNELSQRSAGSYYGNMFLPNTKVEIQTYITANLIADTDLQKSVAEDRANIVTLKYE